MRNSLIFSIFLSAALTVISLNASGQAAEPKSYPMVCRGGDNLTTIISRRNGTRIQYFFNKGTGRASAGLTPGTCTWLDRAMYESESHIMNLSFDNVFITTQIHRSSGKIESLSYGTTGPEPHKTNLKTLLTAIDSGAEFQVHVFIKNGQFEVGKFGP
jgi:hypothetical protein